MTFKSIRRRLLESSILVAAPAAFTIGMVALPGQASAQASAAADVQEVVVTGSRIAGVTNLNSPSPISVATHEDIVLSSAVTVEDVLDRIPAVDFNGGISQDSNNGGGGVSVVSLRNLQPQRTLVLIDGQRLIPEGGSPDINTVPLNMVDHIDVLKDGASSIYGADAIGGVVNIITKKHAEGITMDANYGESGHGDGQTYGINSTIGLNTDKGNLLIGLGWDKRNAVNQSDRDWGVATHSNDPNYPGGSAYRTQLGTLQNEFNSNQIWIGAANSADSTSATLASNAALLPNTAYIAGAGRIKLDAGGVGYQTLVGDLDRKQINVLGHYDITNNITAVAEGFFTDYTAEQKLRPEPLLGDSIATPEYAGFIIPTSNPYNVSGAPITAYLTPNQFGPRIYDEESETYRIKFGFEGKFLENTDRTFLHDFKWEVGYVFQANTTTEVVNNEGNWLHLAELTGQSPCVDVPGGCVGTGAAALPATPINFFNGPNIFTPAQVAYATFKNTTLQHSFERYLYGDINGTLLQLPYGPLQAAFGFESREEHLDNTPDALVQDGYGPNTQQPTAGGYDVKSLYGELRIPIVNHLPFVKALNLSTSGRFDDYSTFGSQTTYKFGIDYEVTNDIRFRASYATAIRAPQVGELFGGTVISDNGGSGDPCETGGPDGNGNTGLGILTAGSTCSKALAKVAGAETNGVVTNFHDILNATPNNQIQALEGGNPDLQPEKARTLTGGFVLTPRWTPGLTVAVDYYSIIINNTILVGGIAASATGSNDLVLDGCYGPEQNAAFCSLVTRDKNGNIFVINSTDTNFGTNKVQGIDYEITYNTRAAHLNLPIPGYFNFDLNITNQIKNTQTNPDGSVTEGNGFFNTDSETNQPKWKGIFTIDYSYNAWKVRWDTRYIRHTYDINGGINGPNTGVYGDAIPDYFYHDISISYDLPQMFGVREARLVFGVNNLLDQDPPFIGTDSTCKCNTIAGGANFDEIGRYFFSRISTKF